MDLARSSRKGVVAITTLEGARALLNQDSRAHYLSTTGKTADAAWAQAESEFPTPLIITFVDDEAAVEYNHGHHVGTVDLLDQLISECGHYVTDHTFKVPNTGSHWDTPHIMSDEIVEIFGPAAAVIVAAYNLEAAQNAAFASLGA